MTDTVARRLGRGLARRCPNCGSRHVFATWFRLKTSCPSCGMRFERLPGFALGAITMNTIVTFGAMLVVMFAGMFATYPDIAVVPIIAGCLVIAVVVPLLFQGSASALWAGIELVMRPLEPRELDEMAARRDGGAPAPTGPRDPAEQDDPAQ